MQGIVFIIIPMIGLWTWAMIRARPGWAVVGGAFGIAPVLQFASGLMVANVLGIEGFFSVPFGGFRLEAPTLILSSVFWMIATAYPSFVLSRRRRQVIHQLWDRSIEG